MCSMGATPIVFIALLHKYGISNNRPFGVHGKLNNTAFRCYIPHADALLNTEIYTAKVHMRLFSTFGDLRGILVEEWNAIPQIRVQRLIMSMRRRCQDVIAAHGGSTHY